MAGDLGIDLAGHIVRRDGAAVEMKPREFDLLALLVKNAGRLTSMFAGFERRLNRTRAIPEDS